MDSYGVMNEQEPDVICNKCGYKTTFIDEGFEQGMLHGDGCGGKWIKYVKPTPHHWLIDGYPVPFSMTLRYRNRTISATPRARIYALEYLRWKGNYRITNINGPYVYYEKVRDGE